MSRTIIPLKSHLIYGPVDSRRLGRSLGLNILPAKSKFCPFDCVYCQYGHTQLHTLDESKGEDCPTVSELKGALTKALSEIPAPEYLTLSGNGEPTIHPDISGIVDMMSAVRDQMAPEAKTAVLSNSTTVNRPGVRKALSKLDVRIMKLDAGTEEVFRRFNVPCDGVEFEELVAGLAALESVTIQTLFAAGSDGNFTQENIDAWIECLKRIKPVAIQIYSLDRGTLPRDLKQIGLDDLQPLSQKLQQLGFDARPYARESD
ncbi:radical SAM protein [Acidobacteriota bacterium]